MSFNPVEEKIYLLLKEIAEKKEITPSDEPISIPFNGNNRSFDFRETPIILKKLEKDHKIISIIHISDGTIKHGQSSKYYGHVFTLTEQFDQYYLELKEKLVKSHIQKSDNTKKILEGFSADTITHYKTLLNVIKNKNEVTPRGTAVKVTCETHYYNDSQIDSSLVEGLMRKLESDFGVIKIIDFSKGDVTGYGNRPEFKIQLLEEKFFNFLKLVESRSGDGLANGNSLEKNLRITYSENSREILLNDLFLISKPNFNSENEQVFYYLYRNPNKTITKAEFEENFNANKTLTKDFNKIVENLKFKKDLRKAFFEISSDSIKFFNPVSKERLEQLGIKNIPIKVE